MKRGENWENVKEKSTNLLKRHCPGRDNSLEDILSPTDPKAP